MKTSLKTTKNPATALSPRRATFQTELAEDFRLASLALIAYASQAEQCEESSTRASEILAARGELQAGQCLVLRQMLDDLNVSDDLAQLNEADVLHASTEVRHPHWAEMIQHRLRQRVRQALILGLPAMAQALHQMNQVEKELPSLHDILRTQVERHEEALACAG